MQTTTKTGTNRICYQCDNHAQSGSMFCPECLPERFPPIIREKPPKPERQSVFRWLSGLLRTRAHVRNLAARIDTLEAEKRDVEQANKALRLRCRDLKTQLKALTDAYDETEAERCKLARKVTSLALDWSPITAFALKHLGNDAQMPAIASFVAGCLNAPCANQNASTAVSVESVQSAPPLGQNPETEIAPGHNPDRLTVAQVGEGWRLITPEEQENPCLGKSNRSMWRGCDWTDEIYNGSISAFTYRVRI